MLYIFAVCFFRTCKLYRLLAFLTVIRPLKYKLIKKLELNCKIIAFTL